jgi:hypothetical protein
MTAPLYFVFDGDPDNGVVPRIPSVDDLGGAEFKNDLIEPPDPGEFPMAEDENQQELVLAALARVATMLNVSVAFVGGNPQISGFETVGTQLVSSGITLTDNGPGDTTISWAANLLPPRECGPSLTLNEDVEIDRARAFVISATSIRVKTKLGSTGTDCAFTLRI